MSIAIVATNASTQRRLGAAFDVGDPWTLAKLDPPRGGPHIQAAAALAHSDMPVRLKHRLESPKVAIVLAPPMVQCRDQFVENTTSGAEWRPLELAISHAAALDAQMRTELHHDLIIDGFSPQFAYVSLADHQRWLAPWIETFGDALLVVHDDRSEAVVTELEQFLDHPADREHLIQFIDTPHPTLPKGKTWDWVWGLLND